MIGNVFEGRARHTNTPPVQTLRTLRLICTLNYDLCNRIQLNLLHDLATVNIDVIRSLSQISIFFQSISRCICTLGASNSPHSLLFRHNTLV